MGSGEGPVSVLGPRPERVYSHATLLELQEHPLARQWPPYLDTAFKNSRGVWDPDRWHLERKRGETPTMENRDEGAKENLGRKESKKERGGLGVQEAEDLQQLVLSPQRRSFLSGCASAGGAEAEVSLRPEQPGAGNKRVGSGRLLARQERDRGEEDRGFRRGEEFKRFPDRREDNKFGSGFRRDREEEGGWGDDRRRDGYYQHDERRDGRRNEERRPQRRRNEPEWMSETISHNDVIELRGFDDKPSKKKEVSPASQLPLSLSLGINKTGPEGPPGLPASGISVEDLERGRHPRPGPERRESGSNDQNQNVIHARRNSGEKPSNVNILNDLGIVPQNHDDQFNFDQIMETMLGGAAEPASQDGPPKSAPKSRFSQFFNKGAEEKMVKRDNSRRSSIQDELLGEILKEINGSGEPGQGPLIKIPSPTEEERYFAPISPAAQTRTAHNPLMEMISKTGGGAPPSNAGPTRVHDLEENLRRQLGLAGGPPPHHHPLGPDSGVQPPQNLQNLFKAVHLHNGQPQHPGPGLAHMMGRPQQPPESDNMSAFKKLVSASLYYFVSCEYMFN